VEQETTTGDITNISAYGVHRHASVKGREEEGGLQTNPIEAAYFVNVDDNFNAEAESEKLAGSIRHAEGT
jgi:hypothetical protein